MSPKQPTEKELLKTVLEPLLKDFQYWFARSRSLLESEKLSFFSAQEQAELLERVKKSQQEVKTAQMLFKAMNGEAGIESRLLVPWHQLVAECGDVARRWRELNNKNTF
ncbi:DUF2605 domain-containing protein [Pleurocapsales cyanobacterium LEGE 06147]|nr:DUF2605 domain-containing protein [Pleurocapsales cyanobacterium LEGE 06147]